MQGQEAMIAAILEALAALIEAVFKLFTLLTAA